MAKFEQSLVSKVEKVKWDAERFGITPKKLYARAFLRNPNLRPIFLSSMPKSGTHLIERVLCLVPQIYRPIIPTLHPTNISEHGGWEKNIKALKFGQLLVTHAHYSMEIDKFLGKYKIAGFTMVRDPRAMVLSQAHYLLKDKSHSLHDFVKGKSIKDIVDFCIDESDEFNGLSFVETMDRFSGWSGSHNTEIIRFEDLVSAEAVKQKALIKRIIALAGVKADEGMITSILAQAFSNVSPTFRSGKVDDWRDNLTTKQQLRILEKANGMMMAFGYEE